MKISFDYLNAGDGFVVEALYDVVENDKQANNCPDLVGTIKGIARPPLSREVAFENRALKRFGQSSALLFFFAASVALLVFQLYEIYSNSSWFLTIPKVLTAAVLLLIAIGLVVALFFTLRSYRIPMKLKISDGIDAFPNSYNELVDRLELSNQKLAAENSLMVAEIKTPTPTKEVSGKAQPSRQYSFMTFVISASKRA